MKTTEPQKQSATYTYGVINKINVDNTIMHSFGDALILNKTNICQQNVTVTVSRSKRNIKKIF